MRLSTPLEYVRDDIASVLLAGSDAGLETLGELAELFEPAHAEVLLELAERLGFTADTFALDVLWNWG